MTAQKPQELPAYAGQIQELDREPKNLAVARHFALSALKQLPEPKRASVKRKRKISA